MSAPNSYQPPKPEHRFDLSGGALCLDFANTLADRPHCCQEHLAVFADLLSWGRQAGVLGTAEVQRLKHRAAAFPEEAEATFRGALRSRERLFRIFSAVARSEVPPNRDLSALNRELSQALPHLQVAADAEGFEWRWSRSSGNLDRILWPVVRSAAELLTSDEVGNVRECASDRCSWLFLDHSRTRRRRWCDMKTCGNRAKARRHYLRKKAQSSPRA